MWYQQVQQPFYISEINILMTMVLMVFSFLLRCFKSNSCLNMCLCVLCHQITTFSVTFIIMKTTGIAGIYSKVHSSKHPIKNLMAIIQKINSFACIYRTMQQEKGSFHVLKWVDNINETVKKVSEHHLQSGITLFKFSN